MAKVENHWWARIVVIIISVGLISTSSWYLYQLFQISDNILTFEDARDTEDILNIFKRDRYWLISTPGYSPEFMLKYRAATQDWRYLGKLQINVLRAENKLVGFVAYYMKTETKGQLLFLAVNPEFRGKGYSEQLAKHALKELKKMGGTVVNLVTRTDNLRAQKLYNRLNFKETKREDGFVYYIHNLNEY